MFNRLLKWFVGPTIVPQVPEPKSIREIMELITRPAVVEKRRTQYVCGFAFYGGHVVLIRKIKPEWQAGKLNGVGGKIEPGEEAEEAMAREFREEAGIGSSPGDWEMFAHCRFSQVDVFFLRSFDEVFARAHTVTAEIIEHWPVDEIPADVIPNLRWLIPLARHNEPGREIVEINYEQNQNSDNQNRTPDVWIFSESV
jgi:8-oxo-dGTP diphosphatase